MTDRNQAKAYAYELATHRDATTGEYGGWEPRLSFERPNVPEGSIRNLEELYPSRHAPAVFKTDARLRPDFDYINSFIGEDRALAFVLCPPDEDAKYRIGTAILGEAGYIPNLPARTFSTEEEASDYIEKLHKAFGTSEDTATAIIGDTMARSRRRQEAAQGLATVALDADEIESLIEAASEFDPSLSGEDSNEMTSALDKLRDALDELSPSSEATHS